jgi:hypothetical protein
LSIAAILLSGTAAYFSVFGLSKLFYAAGISITILAASLEFAKIVTVSYVYRFWKTIEWGLKTFFVFAIFFIMFLTSIGIYGFLTGAYQKSANKLEARDSRIAISENKKTLFVSQLDRINKSIESSSNRINILSDMRNKQENRLTNLYDQKYISGAKRTESQISGSDEQIKILNLDITEKMKQTNAINDSIAFYDEKILMLKSSDISNEIGPYKFVSEISGIPINNLVNIVAFLIILFFDPLAIALLISINKLTINQEEKEVPKIKMKNFFQRLFNKQKKDGNLNDEINSISPVLINDNEIGIKTDINENKIADDLISPVLINDNEIGIKTESNNLTVNETINENKIADDLIYHDKFGVGKIIKTHNNKLVDIDFNGVKKTLNTDYAKLEKIINSDTDSGYNIERTEPPIVENVSEAEPIIIENVSEAEPIIIENVPEAEPIIENVLEAEPIIENSIPKVEPIIENSIPKVEPIIENVPEAEPIIENPIPEVEPIIENVPEAESIIENPIPEVEPIIENPISEAEPIIENVPKIDVPEAEIIAPIIEKQSNIASNYNNFEYNGIQRVTFDNIIKINNTDIPKIHFTKNRKGKIY